MNKSKLSTREFYNIEEMLRSKVKLEKLILERLKRINEYENGSEITRPFNFTEKVQGSSIYKSDLDIRFELINSQRLQILDEQKRVDNINNLLEIIRNDRYFEIIEQRYFKNYSIKEICYNLQMSKDTVIRNRNRLFRIIIDYLNNSNVCPICKK